MLNDHFSLKHKKMKYLILGLAAFFLNSCDAVKTKKNKRSAEEAMSYVAETRDLLMGTLMQKISANGTENALEFCNTNALPLTKTISDKHQTKIKRVSDRNRNPKNKASEVELKMIENYKKQLALGQNLKPEIVGNSFYSPIVTNKACLQCHGELGNNIKPETAKKIAELYPNDKATGYKTDEIRGLFVVELN